MEFYVDGGCLRNGSANAIGVAAAVHKHSDGTLDSFTRRLPIDPTSIPTNQRAEITAVIMALEVALHKYATPPLDLKIYSDSRYAIGCMTEGIDNWRRNGWINVSGGQVANKDLIQKASGLEERVKDRGGAVGYIWISRADNADADKACNQELDRMEDENRHVIGGVSWHYSVG